MDKKTFNLLLQLLHLKYQLFFCDEYYYNKFINVN